MPGPCGHGLSPRRQTAGIENPRAVVLVEGISDKLALETLALRRGRDLAAEGVSVLPVGGAQAFGRFLNLYGPGGSDVGLAGLCDAGEEGELRRALRARRLRSRPRPGRHGTARLLRLRSRYWKTSWSTASVSPCRGGDPCCTWETRVVSHLPEAARASSTLRPRNSFAASSITGRFNSQRRWSRRSISAVCLARSRACSRTSEAGVRVVVAARASTLACPQA